MTTSTLALLLGVIVLLAVGQVLFKYAAGDFHLDQPRSWLSLPLLVALVVYAAATLGWVLVLARVPLSLAFPFYGLAFLIVPILARLFLHEPLKLQTLIGGAVILAGIAISSRGYLK